MSAPWVSEYTHRMIDRASADRYLIQRADVGHPRWRVVVVYDSGRCFVRGMFYTRRGAVRYIARRKWRDA